MRLHTSTLFATIVLIICCWTNPIAAQTGGGYDLSWSTIDGGGGASNGGGYELDGTIGQYDTSTLSGGGFQLSGGFWQAESSVPTAIMLNPNVTAGHTATPYAMLGILSLSLALLSLRMTKGGKS